LVALVALVAVNSHHQITNQHQLGWTAGPGGSARASSRESPDTNKGVQGGFLKELARTAQLTSSKMHSLELLELESNNISTCTYMLSFLKK
jgi:hypothetical protein